MKVKYHGHPDSVQHYNTDQLRNDFLTEHLMRPGSITLRYTIFDRFIYGMVCPADSALELGTYNSLKAETFLERREMGVLNIGGAGVIECDGERFELANGEMLYIGRGTGEVKFHSPDPATPARFYINSCPAHTNYPTQKGTIADANRVELGDQEHANKRVIYQFIHEDGIQSCQLVMGYTVLEPGNIWNTFPPHTHDRRMEVYFYYDLPEDQVVMHFMGRPDQTKSLVVRNMNAVVSPPWSIHAGAGTTAYKFAWGMAGENKAFTDMDGVSFNELL